MKKGKAKTSAPPSSGFVFTVVEEQGDEVIIEVSPEDYEREKAAGVEEEALLKPGRHTFIRGGFLKRHGVTPEEVKQWPVTVEVQARLDLDVYNFFAAQAKGRQVGDLINEIVRQEMVRQTEALPPAAVELLENPKFIKALAIRLANADAKPNRVRKAA